MQKGIKMYWTDLFAVNKLILTVFSESPEIGLIDNIEIKIEATDLDVLIYFDLVDILPDRPPIKWKNKGFNRFRICLRCGNVSEYVFSTNASDNLPAKIDIDLTESNNSKLTIINNTCNLKLACSLIYIQDLNVYFKE